jgi:hypothetical protein
MCNKGSNGHAVIEFALISPWIFTLFIGALNLGLVYHSITAVENAARSASMHASSSAWAAGDGQGACNAALRELRTLPNVRTVVTSCDAAPVELSLTTVEGIAAEESVRVSLTYTTARLIVMPPVAEQLALTRSAEMRVRVE